MNYKEKCDKRHKDMLEHLESFVWDSPDFTLDEFLHDAWLCAKWHEVE